ncbi:c-type cytochrome [Emcibacter sp.]|uniref:c-type cytochrome n=1 Tax=Emcibacter sp. TaxID=1979954 RepID=UPI003A9574F0
MKRTGVLIFLMAKVCLGTAFAADPAALFEETCAACHGAKGEGDVSQNAPAIAGQYHWYISSQLESFRSGVRGADPDRDEDGAMMRSIAEGLEEADIAPLAAYVASLPVSENKSEVVQGNAGLGGGYYEICAACHGVGGEGNAELQAPNLRILSGWYLKSQMQKFLSGARGGPGDTDLGQQMKSMVEVLPDETAMQDVVAYIGTLR